MKRKSKLTKQASNIIPLLKIAGQAGALFEKADWRISYPEGQRPLIGKDGKVGAETLLEAAQAHRIAWGGDADVALVIIFGVVANMGNQDYLNDAGDIQTDPKSYAALLHEYGEYSIEALCLNGKIYDRIEVIILKHFPKWRGGLDKAANKTERTKVLVFLSMYLAGCFGKATSIYAAKDNKPGVTGPC